MSGLMGFEHEEREREKERIYDIKALRITSSSST